MEPDYRTTHPPLTFLLEIDAALMPIGSAGHPLNEAIHGMLITELSKLMETLGVPGNPAVELKSLPAPALDGRFLKLAVGGQILHYSYETLRSVYCWLAGVPIRVDVTAAEMLPEMKAWLNQGSEPDACASLISQMCLAIIKLQPAVLLGQPQLAAYTASLPVPERKEATKWPPDQAWLFPVLRQVLSLKISIADKQAVADALASCIGEPVLNASEELIEALCPDAVEIHVEREYLRQLTTIDAEHRTGLLAFLRDGMFVELGVLYPHFRLLPDTSLAPQQFMFKLNHLTCVPQVGLGPEECLVNEIPERLGVPGITAVLAGNPATAQRNSITNLEHKKALEDRGFTIWDQMGYLILSLASTLRSNAGCFVSRRFAKEQLQQVKAVFPALVKTVRSTISVEEITAILRNLAAEEISVRNLRLILERLLDYQFRNDAGWSVALDDAAPAWTLKERKRISEDHLSELTRFVRTGMRRQISRKYARGTNTIVVYLMDRGIEGLMPLRSSNEQAALVDSRSTEDQQERVLAAVRNEIQRLPLGAQIPCILTVGEVREHLREAIVREFPRVSVVAYEEILPGLNVQPVARLS